MDQSAKAEESMEPIILVTEANVWCVKITVNAKWVMTKILTLTQSR